MAAQDVSQLVKQMNFSLSAGLHAELITKTARALVKEASGQKEEALRLDGHMILLAQSCIDRIDERTGVRGVIVVILKGRRTMLLVLRQQVIELRTQRAIAEEQR